MWPWLTSLHPPPAWPPRKVSGSYLICGAQHRTYHINETIIPINVIFIKLKEEGLVLPDINVQYKDRIYGVILTQLSTEKLGE